MCASLKGLMIQQAADNGVGGFEAKKGGLDIVASKLALIISASIYGFQRCKEGFSDD